MLRFLLPLLFAGSASAAPLKIMIDPGHGGIDTGAVSGRAKESEIALKVALALKARLVADSRFQPSMTREKDSGLSLPERVKKADAAGADLFLSIHANASPDPRAKGAEFYFQNQLPPDEESLFLASNENKMEKLVEAPTQADLKKESDVLAIVEDLKRQNRLQHSFQLTRILSETWKNSEKVDPHSVRQAPFYVISKTNRPAVLVELGFVTHPLEGPKLAKKEEQERVAENIYRSLVKFVEGTAQAPHP